MSNLSDEFQKRMAVKPDQYTLAWWEQRFGEVMKAYRGATHAINLAVADAEMFRQRVKELEDRLAEDVVKLGELQARVERMAEFLNKQKNVEKP